MSNQTTQKRKSYTRSPGYPTINLEDAMGRVQSIKEKEGGGGHFIPYSVALNHIGFSAGSSGGIRKLSALKKFGLTEERGKGKAKEIKLSDLSTKLLFFRENQEDGHEYQFALKDAALMPSIHRELWDKYEGNLPSDQTIKTYLVIHREGGKFSENAVDDFIRQFRATIYFAKLTKDDNMFGDVEDKKPLHTEEKMETIPEHQASGFSAMQAPGTISQTFNFPVKISDKLEASLTLQYPMEEEDLRDFLTALEALKPGILQSVLDKQNGKDEED